MLLTYKKTIDNYNSRLPKTPNMVNTLKKDIELLINKKNELFNGIESRNTDDAENIFKQLMELKEELYTKKSQLRVAEGKGYSPEKRFSELTDILKKEGSDSPRYLWRKAVLQAEVKYGKYLNDIQDDIENSYTELLKALKKNNNYKAKSVFSSDQDIEIMTSSGLKSSPDAFVLDESTKETIENIVDQLQDIVNIPLSTHIASITDDVYTFSGKNSKTKNMSTYESLHDFPFWKDGSDGFIDIGGVFSKEQDVFSKGYNSLADPNTHLKEIIWHEMGHIIEHKMQNTLKTSQAFLIDREAEDLFMDATQNTARDVLSKNKKIAQDHFYSPYMGVQHIRDDTITATELISSGFEGLSSPWMTRSMVVQDRESLLYAIAISEMEMA